MGVFVRKDSPYYWLRFPGYRDDRGNPLREATHVRHDANTPSQRREDRELAERRFYERMHELASGTNAPDGPPARTFAEQAAWFTKHKLPYRKGREREERIIPNLVAVFGRYQLAAITRSLVTERWVTPRLTTPTAIKQSRRTAARLVKAGPRTINREVDALKAVLNSAVPDYLEVSPLFGMPLLKTTTPKRRLMSADEETQLLAIMAPDDKALFLIAVDSLVRLTDVIDIRRTDDHGTTVWIGDPKAGGGFEVPLSTRARRALDAWYADRHDDAKHAYIFHRHRRAKTERDRRGRVGKMLARYCRILNIPHGRKAGGLTFHWATRRTGATRMLTRKVDLGTVQKVGRWKTPAIVLGIYHELLDDQAFQAVNSVAGDPPRDPGRARKTGKRGRTR